MLYGRGFQTWEYAPQYAFRSYGYVGLHALIGLAVGGAWGADKVDVFQRSRSVLALVCALCEALFCYGVALRLGKRLGAYVVAALAVSAGMLHAAPSFLPSTFTMDLLLLSWGGWLAGSTSGAVWGAATALCLGWPFAVVAILPYGLHLLVRHRFSALLFHGCAAAGVMLGACALVDRWFFGHWLVAAWNIIKYNAFGVGGGGQGGDLYGVEPPTFYAANLLLNFNVLFPLAALAPVAAVALWLRLRREQAVSPAPQPPPRRQETEHALVLLSQLLLWLGFMSSRPHKEERFMFVVFPLTAFAAALSLHEAEAVAVLALTALRAPALVARRVAFLAVVAVLALAGAASASRIASQVRGFAAPFAAYTALSEHLREQPTEAHPLAAFPIRTAAEHASLASRPRGPRVCVGKEWYRMPASFFLPEATRGGKGPAELAFVKSGFGGQLPQPYLAGANATSTERSGFNDANQEEPDRYVDLASCDYVVDLELPTPREAQDWQFEPWFGRPSASSGDGMTSEDECPLQWSVLWSARFLHAESTPRLARAFYVPGWSDAVAVYGNYKVLQQLPSHCKK